MSLSPFMKHFLSNSSGDTWRSMRNVITPTFSGAKMKAVCFLKLIIVKKHCIFISAPYLEFDKKLKFVKF